MTPASPGWPRIVLHADMDAFYAAVEQHDHPELRGRPVLVGGESRRAVVCTASYEARPFGVHSAMPMVEARRRCPQAVVVPPRFARYHEVSTRIMEVFGRFSPQVEPLSLDEAFLEMTGAEGLFGPPEQMARAIKQQVVEATDGLTVSVGGAPTKFVAKVASDYRKPDGLTLVPAGQVLEFLHPLKVERLWGVGPRTRERLAALGLETIGDVARADRQLLVRRFGGLGEQLAALARGEDPRQVEPDREAKSIGAETTLEQDVAGAAAIGPHLRRAAARVARQLRREGLLAGAVQVKLKTATFQLLARQAPLPRPTDSERVLEQAAVALLEAFDLAVPMRLVGLSVFRLAPLGAERQGELFPDRLRERDRRLGRTLDELKERFGEEVVQRGSEVEDGEEGKR